MLGLWRCDPALSVLSSSVVQGLTLKLCQPLLFQQIPLPALWVWRCWTNELPSGKAGPPVFSLCSPSPAQNRLEAFNHLGEGHARTTFSQARDGSQSLLECCLNSASWVEILPVWSGDRLFPLPAASPCAPAFLAFAFPLPVLWRALSLVLNHLCFA